MRARRWFATLPLLLASLAFGAGCDMDGAGDGVDSTPASSGGSGSSGGGVIPPGASGDFTQLASLNVKRYMHTGTLLTDGRILVCGGRDITGAALQSVEIYDPSTQAWIVPGGGTVGLAFARYSHTATLLSSGKVLIAGGTNGSATIARLEVFDPTTSTFSLGQNLNTARYNHSALLLPNGHVHIAGGNTGSTILNSAEIYVTSTGQVLNVNNALLQARELHSAVTLSTGKVLLAGGQAWIGVFPQLLTINSCELFTPGGTYGENGIYTATAPLGATRARARGVRINAGTAQGQVLLVGGYTNNPTSGTFNTAELYDPNAGTSGAWNPVIATMQSGRYAHRADALTNGTIVIVGGQSTNAPELLDPYGQTGAGGVDQTATITRTQSAGSNTQMVGVNNARSWHASVVTGNGLVVYIGGLDAGPTGASTTATDGCEFYTR